MVSFRKRQAMTGLVKKFAVVALCGAALVAPMQLMAKPSAAQSFTWKTVPWGGGGLSCGIASVLKEKAPHVKVYAAEVETGAPLAASLAAGASVLMQEQPTVRKARLSQAPQRFLKGRSALERPRGPSAPAWP